MSIESDQYEIRQMEVRGKPFLYYATTNGIHEAPRGLGLRPGDCLNVKRAKRPTLPQDLESRTIRELVLCGADADEPDE